MSHPQRWTQILRSGLFAILGVIALTVATFGAAMPVSAASGEPSSTGSPDADTAYTFWSYWTGEAKSEWTFAQKGAQSIIPADATSQGWRFGVGETPTLTEKPRATVDFEAACSGTAPTNGKKRVAVVIDSGTTAEAPAGQVPPGVVTKCASVPTNANGLQVLSSVTAIRQDSSGLVCGVGNYPTTGCGEQVSVGTLTAAQDATSPEPAGAQTSSSTTWLPFALGAIVIVIVALAGVVVSRRRRDRST
ncbi:MAG: SCO2322 family protein [Candidatus Nanopelagicales bacterium]